jgi:hypothetical protein
LNRLPGADRPVPAALGDRVEEIASVLRRSMQRGQLKAHETAVPKLADVPVEVAVERWVHSVEATTNRAGLLLASELDAADKILALGSARSSVEKQMDDLLVFATSQEHFDLRAKLGLDIKVGG